MAKKPMTEERLLHKIAYHQDKVEKYKLKLEKLRSGELIVNKPYYYQDRECQRYIYALLCEGGFYYVGQSVNPHKRFNKHIAGKGSWFTRAHKPIEILEIHDVGLCTMADCMNYETELAAKYLFEYGLERVRGGEFIQRSSKHFIKKLNNYAPVEITYI